MDLGTIVTFSSLLLVTAGSNQTTPELTTSQSDVLNSSSNPAKDHPCPSPRPADPPVSVHPASSAAPSLGLVKVNWTRKCEGSVCLISNLSINSSSLPVCDSQLTSIRRILKDVCLNQKGCEDALTWHRSDQEREGYEVTEMGINKIPACKTVMVKCKAEEPSHVERQLQAYRVVTALLCCVLMILLLICFSRPTVKALQKRLSDRRQNRWIGPTQSHSVSYHRGKAAVRCSDGEKRLSFPALERLTTGDSTELSSNRNSGYNF